MINFSYMFQINNDHIDDNFLQHDVYVGSQRHLIFYTPEQIELLGRSVTWYMDGTFRVVREPFYQLFSIHAFIKREGVIKQIPLVFVLMSRRKTKDYVKVMSGANEKNIH